MLDFGSLGFEKDARWNTHLVFEQFHVEAYVRKTVRFIDGKRVRTLDLATVKVDEEYQGKGWFRKFIQEFETHAHDNGLTVYVESILNMMLYLHLKRRGYVSVPGTVPACVYLHPKKEVQC